VASLQFPEETEITWQLATGNWKLVTDMKMTDVIRRPLITEKTTLLREGGRTVVFEVAPGATKVDIKRAVEKLLGSKVESVRTAISHGKVKRQGRFAGQRSDWKKAYVKLREGEKVPEFLEGA
jgi:large subunit ribosomal protein L23